MKLAELDVVDDGGADEIVVIGGVVSGGVYVHETAAGWLTFPALSLPFTEKECGPGAIPLIVTGLPHATKLPPSVEQLNATPGSFAVNAICTLSVEVAAEGPLVIVTVGAVVSGAGVGLGLGFGSGFGFGSGSGSGSGFGLAVVVVRSVVAGGATGEVGGAVVVAVVVGSVSVVV